MWGKAVLLLLASALLFPGCSQQPQLSEEQAIALAEQTPQAVLLKRFDAVYARAGNCTQAGMDSLVAVKFPGSNSSFLYGELRKISACGQKLSRKAESVNGALLVTYSFSYANPACGAAYDALRVAFPGNQAQAQWADSSIEKEVSRVSSLLDSAERAGDCGLAVFFFES